MFLSDPYRKTMLLYDIPIGILAYITNDTYISRQEEDIKNKYIKVDIEHIFKRRK